MPILWAARFECTLLQFKWNVGNPVKQKELYMYVYTQKSTYRIMYIHTCTNYSLVFRPSLPTQNGLGISLRLTINQNGLVIKMVVTKFVLSLF